MTQREIIVRVADLRVGKGHDVLVTVGLGSCVAIPFGCSTVTIRVRDSVTGQGHTPANGG